MLPCAETSPSSSTRDSSSWMRAGPTTAFEIVGASGPEATGWRCWRPVVEARRVRPGSSCRASRSEAVLSTRLSWRAATSLAQGRPCRKLPPGCGTRERDGPPASAQVPISWRWLDGSTVAAPPPIGPASTTSAAAAQRLNWMRIESLIRDGDIWPSAGISAGSTLRWLSSRTTMAPSLPAGRRSSWWSTSADRAASCSSRLSLTSAGKQPALLL